MNVSQNAKSTKLSTFAISDLITKKKNGEELSQDDIEYFVKGVVEGRVQQAQLGAMLMAIVLKDLTDNETTCLTRAMIDSGETLQWPDGWQGMLVDKHSTGGVGDKISLVLAPALAACGMKVPMVSGRGLGHTGGTLDKLESIPGYKVSMETQQMQNSLNKAGCFIAGQTNTFVPADKIIYATRDVTGTVDHIGLIAASIISKKAAEKINALVLDVKCGKGAFCKSEKSGRELANRLVAIGKGLGIKTVALLTRMDAPIGMAIGNALEVAEAIRCLQGNGPSDVMELVVKLGGHVLQQCGKVSTVKEGCEKIEETLKDTSALQTFVQMIEAQCVDREIAERVCDTNTDIWTILPKAKYTTCLSSPKSGYIHEIDAMSCAVVCGNLGAGRARSGDPINYAVGLELQAHTGDKISQGDVWVKVYHDQELLQNDLTNLLQEALVVEENPVQTTNGSLILDVIT